MLGGRAEWDAGTSFSVAGSEGWMVGLELGYSDENNRVLGFVSMRTTGQCGHPGHLTYCGLLYGVNSYGIFS